MTSLQGPRKPTADGPPKSPSLKVTKGDFEMTIEGLDSLSVLRLAQGLGQQLAGGLAPAQPPDPQSTRAAAEALQAQGAAKAGAAGASVASRTARAPTRGACAGAPAAEGGDSGAAWPVPEPGAMREWVRWGSALMPAVIQRALACPVFVRLAGSEPRQGDLSHLRPSPVIKLPARGDELLARIKAGQVFRVKLMAEERSAAGAAGAGRRVLLQHTRVARPGAQAHDRPRNWRAAAGV